MMRNIHSSLVANEDDPNLIRPKPEHPLISKRGLEIESNIGVGVVIAGGMFLLIFAALVGNAIIDPEAYASDKPLKVAAVLVFNFFAGLLLVGIGIGMYRFGKRSIRKCYHDARQGYVRNKTRDKAGTWWLYIEGWTLAGELTIACMAVDVETYARASVGSLIDLDEK